jgi:transcriptional regulator with XRE-family HTH domain
MTSDWLEFWDAQGLRTIAELIQTEIEKPGCTRQSLATAAGVSHQTIANLLKNLENEPGNAIHPPKPDVILNLARVLPNPDSMGQTFDPEELLKLARGLIRLRSAIDASKMYLVQKLPFPAAVLELWRLIGDRTVERAARDWDIPLERLTNLLESNDPALATPTISEVYRIVSKSYPDKVANRLINLYVDPKKLPQAN